MIYTYDPARIGESGTDRMRFELGDVAVAQGAETCALSDEEYDAVLALYPGKWGRAKLALVESVLRRFSYEVNTSVGQMRLELQGRQQAWQQIYDALRREMASAAPPVVNAAIQNTPGYFHEGMHCNPPLSKNGQSSVPPPEAAEGLL